MSMFLMNDYRIQAGSQIIFSVRLGPPGPRETLLSGVKRFVHLFQQVTTVFK